MTGSVPGFLKRSAWILVWAVIGFAGWQYRIQVAGEPRLDSMFVGLAQQFLATGSLPADPYYPPGLIVFFSIPLATFGSLAALSMFQVCISLLECILGSWLAGRMFGRAAAVVSFLLLCLWPYGVRFSVGTNGEVTPILLFLFLSLHAWLSGTRRQSPLWFAWSGFFMGLTGLLRTSLFLLPVFVAVSAFVWRRLSVKRRGIAITLFLLSAYLLYVPWAVRNYQLTRKVVVTGVQGRLLGMSLLIGIGEVSGKGGAMFFDTDMDYFFGLGSPVFVQNYDIMNRSMGRRALEILASDPRILFRMVAKRLGVLAGFGSRTYFLASENRPSYWKDPPGLPFYALGAFQKVMTPLSVLLLFGTSLGLLLRRDPSFLVVIWTLLYLVLVHVPIHLEGRYLFLVYPLMLVSIAGLIPEIWLRLKSAALLGRVQPS